MARWQYAICPHIRNRKRQIVQVNAARFAIDKAVFYDICETALSFERSVVSEYEKFRAVKENESSSDSNEEEELQESEGDSIVYRRQRTPKGNRYATIVGWQACFQNSTRCDNSETNNCG